MVSALAFVNYPFMQNALMASVLASVACGIVGTLVVCNRLTFLAGGASHAAYGGIGLAFHFKLPVLFCTAGFSLLAALAMGAIMLHHERQSGYGNPDAAIGVLWAAGMAFGIILIELTPGYAGELMGFLFGSILVVPTADLVVMAGFDLLLIGILWLCHQGLWAISFDRDFAEARGLPVQALFLLVVGITAVAVVMLIRVVGLILVLALLTIPPYLARRCCRSFLGSMAIAGVFALGFCLSGLALSWHTDISSGAAIIAVAACAYFGVSLMPKIPRHVYAVLALLFCFILAPGVANAAKQTKQPSKPIQTEKKHNDSKKSEQKQSDKAKSDKKQTASKQADKKSGRKKLSNRRQGRFTYAGPVESSAVLAEKAISSGYGSRRGRMHSGVDIPALRGSEVLALEEGLVIFSGRDKGYGICVTIQQENGLSARYAHLTEALVNEGERVTHRQVIGTVGSSGRATGSHLHFELAENGVTIDPTPFLNHGSEIAPRAGERGPSVYVASRVIEADSAGRKKAFQQGKRTASVNKGKAYASRRPGKITLESPADVLP